MRVTPIHLLFCNNPLNPKEVDTDFEEEYTIAHANGFITHLLSFEALTKDKDVFEAIRKIKAAGYLQKIMYRGWMLRPTEYSLLYEALLQKNYQLVNSPEEYRNCHYLPESLRFIQPFTPKTVWVNLDNGHLNEEEIINAITIFGDKPFIVKDYVKSQKHYWDTDCFIPSASDREKVLAIVERFMELQGDDLNEGIVLREFVELADLTLHSKSNMPLKQEYRLFFSNKKLIGCYDYWEEGNYPVAEKPPLDFFSQIAEGIDSHFFTLDVAKTAGGEWIIIETGDGQVAGLPDNADKTAVL